MELKSTVVKVANFVPGGSLLTRFMDEEHEFRELPGQRGRVSRQERLLDAHKNGWMGSQFFLNKSGLAIFWRSWAPKDPENINGIVVISHGLGEHSGRYEKVGKALAEKGNFAVYALDHQGHGQSEGTRQYVKNFADYCEDIKKFTEFAKDRHLDTKKTFLLGHSMGALISIHTVSTYPELFDAVVLNSPPLKLELPPFADKVGPVLASYLPKLPAPGIDISTLCRDEAVVDRYMNDPLVCHSLPTLRLISELICAVKAVPTFAKEFPLPYLLQHGLEDRICLPDGSIGFHQATEIEDKTLITYQDGFHELLNEPGCEENAIARALQWLLQHK